MKNHADFVHSTKHTERNLVDLEKPALPADIVQTLDVAWVKIRPLVWQYWH